MSTAPASSSPTCSPIVVETGSNALRSTCRPRTVPGARPFELAVRTKSEPSTSSTEARVIRTITASGIVASVIAGRTRWRRASRLASNSRVRNPSSTAKPVTFVASTATDWRPDGGNQPRSTANTSFST